MLPNKAFLDLVLRNEEAGEPGMDEEQPACNAFSPLTPGCSVMLALSVTGVFLAILLLFGLPLYMRLRAQRAKQARLDASKSHFTTIPIRSQHPRPRSKSSAKHSDTRPPGYGSTHAYLANEKAQSGMSPMLTRHYPGRPATPPAVQVRDGFPTTPSYDSLAYHDEKLPVYVVEDTV